MVLDELNPPKSMKCTWLLLAFPKEKSAKRKTDNQIFFIFMRLFEKKIVYLSNHFANIGKKNQFVAML